MSKTIPREIAAREVARRKLEMLAEAAPTSMAAHATLLHRTAEGRPVVPARHHMEWIRVAQDVEKYRFVVVVAPPGYAKSTWFSMIYPAWRIGVTKGRVRIGIVSNTASLTYGFSRSIQRTISDESFASIYGVRPDFQRGWAQNQFWVTGSSDPANPTVMASGIGGPLQGKRFDEIILDDPTTWDEARSDVTMEGQRHWLKALLLQRFPPGMGPPDGHGRMIAVMTRWGERDLVPTLQEVGFKIVTMPALGYWDRKEIAPGEYEWGEEALWPQLEDRDKLLREREEDQIVFELVKQGNPRALAGDVFDPNTFQHGPLPPREEMEQVIQYADTAGGKDRKRGDFFALTTIGLQKGGEKIWIMDVERGRYAAPEQEAAVIREAHEHTPDLLCIEDMNEGTALYQRLIISTRLPLKAVVPIRDKEFRAIPLANAYRSLRVWHPTGQRWVRSYEAELSAFPNGAHDDQVDSAAGAYNQSASSGPRLRILARTTPPRRFR